MPLFKKNTKPSLAAALPFAKSCEMLWRAICFHPQRIPLKNSAAQLHSLYFKPSEGWIFWRTPQPSLPPSPAVQTHLGSAARESMGLQPAKAKHSLEKKTQIHNSLSAHVFFSSSWIPCLPCLKLKLKKPIKCLSYSIFFKGSDIKLFGEQLFLGMRTADWSLFLSSSVLRAKIPYQKRRLRRAWLCRYSSGG